MSACEPGESGMRTAQAAQNLAAGWLILLSLAFSAMGCHRSFYREQADLEAYDLIAEKSAHPHWDLTDFVIDPDPTSRMAAFDNPDCPPMPMDDPVANELMHYVDQKPGWPFWDVNGHTNFVENPAWRSFLPLDEDGVLHLDTETAVKLALVHSPDYQTQLETLYLSALDVSAERFAFDPQHSAGYQVEYDAFGRLHPSGGGASSSVLNASTRNVQVRRFFTTGAELVAGVANSLIWQFSGSDNFTGSTLVNFSLVQPLLRSAGRDRIMESLTLAERNLLYGVRQMERFRRGFYLDISMGIGRQPGPGRSGAAGQFTVGGSGAGGLLGLLQQKLQIQNQEANLDALSSSLTQLEALSRRGAIEFFQVDQTRGRVTSGITSLLNSKRRYRDTLDGFKRSLGLPPTLKVVIDDDRLDPIGLTDPRIRQLQDKIKAQRIRVSATNIALLDEFRKGDEFRWTPELEKRLRELKTELAGLNALLREAFDTTRGDILDEIEDLRAALPKRRQFNAKMRKLIELAKESDPDSLFADVDLQIFNVDQLYGLRKLFPDQTQREISLDELPDYLVDWLDTTLDALSLLVDGNVTIEKKIDLVLENGPNMDPMELKAIVDLEIQKPNPDQFNLAEAGAIELLLIGALARAESLMLPEVDISAEEAVEIARIFRRDWMNARASLIDSWRFIQFTSDELQSVLDIVFTGEIRNRGDNPLRLRDAAGALGVGVQFDAPLARLLERNSYRESLVRYQAARRNYYQVEDQISQSLRSTVRLVNFGQVDFEVQRTALRVAVAQVRSSRAAIEEPPKPGQPYRLGPTASLNLINALSSLNSSQDAFIGVWVGYEVQRGLLDLQMGTMQLDENGLWIDPGPIGPKLGYPSEDSLRDVPEYTHGAPSLDDLLYRHRDGMFDREILPAPAPDQDGPNPGLDNPVLDLPLNDLTAVPAESGDLAAAPAPQANLVQPASFAAPEPERGDPSAPDPEAPLHETESQPKRGTWSPPERRLQKPEGVRNPLREGGFDVNEAARAAGRRLRR